MYRVTKEQILKAREKGCNYCPFQLAFAEGLGLKPSCIIVGEIYTVMLIPDLERVVLYIPAKERAWIYAFDHNEDSRPITFSPEKWKVID